MVSCYSNRSTFMLSFLWVDSPFSSNSIRPFRWERFRFSFACSTIKVFRIRCLLWISRVGLFSYVPNIWHLSFFMLMLILFFFFGFSGDRLHSSSYGCRKLNILFLLLYYSYFNIHCLFVYYINDLLIEDMI